MDPGVSSDEENRDSFFRQTLEINGDDEEDKIGNLMDLAKISAAKDEKSETSSHGSRSYHSNSNSTGGYAGPEILSRQKILSMVSAFDMCHKFANMIFHSVSAKKEIQMTLLSTMTYYLLM